MSTIDDYPIPSFQENTPEPQENNLRTALRDGAAIGALILPMLCFEITTPELTKQYAEILAAELGAGSVLGGLTAGVAYAIHKHSANKK